MSGKAILFTFTGSITGNNPKELFDRANARAKDFFKDEPFEVEVVDVRAISHPIADIYKADFDAEGTIKV